MTEEELRARYNATLPKTNAKKNNQISQDDLRARWEQTRPVEVQQQEAQQAYNTAVAQAGQRHGQMAQQGQKNLAQKQAVMSQPILQSTTPVINTQPKVELPQQLPTDPKEIAQLGVQLGKIDENQAKQVENILRNEQKIGGNNLVPAQEILKSSQEYTKDPTPYKDILNNLADTEMKTGIGLVPGLITKATAQLPEDILQNYIWGFNEGTGGTYIYKLAKGQDAVNDRLYALQNIYNGPGSNIARTGGNILGAATLMATGSAAGGAIAGQAGVTPTLASNIGTIGASAVGGGARTATYTDNLADILANAGISGATTAAFMGTTGLLGSKLPIFNNAAGNVAKNVGIGATAGYTSTTANKGLTNIYKSAKGENVTGDDWKGTFASPEHLSSAITSGIGYGIQGTLRDQAILNKQGGTVQNTKATKAEAYKTLGLKKDATEQEIIAASKRLVKQYHPDTGGATANAEKFNEVLRARDYLLENSTPNTSFTEQIKNIFKGFVDKFKPTPTQTAQTNTQVTNPYLPAATTNNTLTTIPTTPAVTSNVASALTNVPKAAPIQEVPQNNQVDTQALSNYNNIKLGEVKNVPTESLMPFVTDGGFRDAKQIQALKGDIAKNGIKEPIELVRNNDGTISIENGNHRLQIAKELGITKVPVTFVDSWENLGKTPDITETNVIRGMENYDRINGNNPRDYILDEKGRNIQTSSTNGSNQFENKGTTIQNAELLEKESYSNKPTSNIRTNTNNQMIENSKQSSFLMQENEGIPSYLNDLETYTNHHVERELNNETRQPRFGIPKVRKGWNIDKIQKQLKGMSSRANSGPIVLSYDTPEELSKNIYYHGANSVNSRLKAGSTVPEGNRNGGYGDEYHSISLSKSKNIASNFAGPMTGNGVVYPVVLHKNANVIEMPEIQDAIDLEEMLPELWEKGVDAVKIGDWNDGYSEQELVVLNPHAITTITNSPYVEYVKQYGKPKYQNMSLDEVKDLQEHYKQQMDKNRLGHIDKLKAKKAKDSTMLPTNEELTQQEPTYKKDILPSTEELKQFEQSKKQSEIAAIRKGAKALSLEEEQPKANLPSTFNTIPPATPPTPPSGTPPTEPTEPPEEPDEKIAQLLKERPSRAKMTLKEKAENAYKTLVNKGYFVDKLADESGNKQLKYKYDKMLSSANEGNYVVGEKQTNNEGKIIGKSVNEIWKPVEDAGKVEEFSDYLLHKLNIDRMSLENIDELIKAENTFNNFVKDHQDIVKYSPATLKRIADGKATIIDGKVKKVDADIPADSKLTELVKQYLDLDKQVDILENRKNKPVFGDNVTADDSRKIVAKYEKENPKFAEWSKDVNTFNKNQLQNMVDAGLASEETQELLNNMYDNYIRIQREVGGDRPITNQRGRLKVNSPIKKAKGGNQDILPLKDSMAQQAVEVKKAIARNQFGQELLNTIGGGEEVEDYGEVLKQGKNGEAPTFTVFKDGKPVTMKINTELYEALKPSERAAWEDSVIANGLQKAVKFQKSVLTSKNPIFAFTNFVRDLQTAIVNSTDTKNMLKNYAKLAKFKFAELYSKASKKELSAENQQLGDLWELYKANGGESNTYFDFEHGTNLEEPNKVKGFLGKQIDRIFAVNEIIEQLPRVSEFITTLENGGTIEEAMYNAADITVNFKRGGEFTKLLDRNGASFLNASVQGLDKQIRNFTKNGKGFAKMLIAGALFGIAPQLLNHLLLHDDEDYQDLPDYIKDNYWLIKTGDNTFLRIPRGRDIPTFLGVIAQRTSRAAEGDKHAFDGLVDTFSNTLAPNNPIEDNIFAPLVAMGTNKSWNGNDIVSSTLENKTSDLQYDAKDTELAKWLAGTDLGKKLGWSPKKIDYLLDQYSGGIGDVLIPMNTKYAEGGNALSAKFTTDSVTNNKQLSRFYDDKTELTKKKNSGTATEQEQYKYKYFTDVADDISELNKQKRDIEMSDLSDKEKISQVTEIQKQVNQLAKDANKNAQKYGEVADDYSDDIYEDIFNSEMYKNSYDQEKFTEKIREKVSKDANSKAKESLDPNKADIKLNYAIDELEEYDIPLADYYLSYYAMNNLAQGSSYSSKQKAIKDNVDGLSNEQLDVLYGIFNIQYKRESK